MRKKKYKINTNLYKHRLFVVIAIRAHEAITVHIKKPNDFQRNESRERQSDLLFVGFSR